MAHTYLARAQPDFSPSVYVLEAAIAAQHVIAPTYAETSWTTLLKLYDLLEKRKPNPMVRLNRAVVLIEMGENVGALQALQALDEAELTGHEHLYHCVLAQVYERLGDGASRLSQLSRALEFARGDQERALIRRRMGSFIG